jgi:hypothetical protein
VSILDELGIDPDDLRWESLAACNRMDPNLFFDDTDLKNEDSLTYSDPVTAMIVDQVCLSCPVNGDCLQIGTSENRWGVWGGVYLTDGAIDGKMNKHKTEEDWKIWRKTVESQL